MRLRLADNEVMLKLSLDEVERLMMGETVSVKFNLPDHGQVNWTVTASDDVDVVSVTHTNVFVGRKAMQDERDAGGSKQGISVCQDGTNFHVQIDLKDIQRAKKK